MCGEIRCAQNSDQAIDFGIAYAVDWHGRPVLDNQDDMRDFRSHINNFIDNYVPAAQRADARERLTKKPDAELTTQLKYWDDVVVDTKAETGC